MENTKSADEYIKSIDNYTAEDLHEALGPIASLRSKSKKALQKLTPGTWQHKMLQDNIKALDYAFVLMNKDVCEVNSFTQNDLQEVIRSFTSMIVKTEKVQVKFSPGTSQYTLLRNRLKSLYIALSLINKSLGLNIN